MRTSNPGVNGTILLHLDGSWNLVGYDGRVVGFNCSDATSSAWEAAINWEQPVIFTEGI